MTLLSYVIPPKRIIHQTDSKVDLEDIEARYKEEVNEAKHFNQLQHHIAALNWLLPKLEEDLIRAEQCHCKELVLSTLKRQATWVRERQVVTEQEVRDGYLALTERRKTTDDLIKARQDAIDQKKLAMDLAGRLLLLHGPASKALKALTKSIKWERRLRFWTSSVSSTSSTRLTEFHRLAQDLARNLLCKDEFDRLEAQFRDLICLVLKKREDQVDFEFTRKRIVSIPFELLFSRL